MNYSLDSSLTNKEFKFYCNYIRLLEYAIADLYKHLEYKWDILHSYKIELNDSAIFLFVINYYYMIKSRLFLRLLY